jgi:hypothetical protein
MMSSTGHLAMSQTVTAVEPSPEHVPDFLCQAAGHDHDDGRNKQDHRRHGDAQPDRG